MKVYVIAAVVAVLGFGLTVSMASSESNIVPDWIKSTAGWWSEGLVSDAEYIATIQWLVDEGYIELATTEGSDLIVRDSMYSIEQPPQWDRQIPERDQAGETFRDSMVNVETMDSKIPATVSVTVSEMMGEDIDEHREWGLELIKEYIGDGFEHTGMSNATINGKDGYIDEYIVTVLNFEIQGISYSFEHEGLIYEIKYESDVADFDRYIDEAQRIIETFSLER